MYPGFPNSPVTTLAETLTIDATSATVIDGTKLPDTLPNLLTIGTDVDAETVLVTVKNSNVLTITRGIEGSAKQWNPGEIIGRMFTNYDHNAFKSNIEDLDSRVDDLEVMTTEGDIIYQGASAPTRLAKGTGKQVLRINASATAPEWVANTRGIAFYLGKELAVNDEVSFIAPCALTITNIKMDIGTAPTGANLIVDIHKNGTTIFTTQANRPTIVATETTEDSSAPDVTSIVAGDKITLIVDQVGSTVKGTNLSATVICEVA